MVESLPTELLERIIEYLVNSYDISFLSTLSSCALVNKAFNTLACRHLYESVHLHPDYYPAFSGELQSISSNPRLGKYVKSFRTGTIHDFDRNSWDSKPIRDLEPNALLAFSNMDRLRFLALSPTFTSESFFLTTHEPDRWSSLQELHIWALHPFEFMWNPRRVEASRSLAGLTKLRWSFFNTESKLPFSWDPGNIRLIQTISFLAAVLESSCPSLTHLDIQTLDPFHPTCPWDKRGWKYDDYQVTLERAVEASRSSSEFPCRLGHISSLSLGFFDDHLEEESEETLQSVSWATAFFRPQLDFITELGIHLPSTITSIYEQLLDPFVMTSSASLTHLTLEAHNPDSSPIWDSDSPRWNLSKPRPTVPHLSFEHSLQTLVLKFLIILDAELTTTLQHFSSLRSLYLTLDTTEWFNLDIVDGSWVLWENLHLFLLDKTQYLPPTLRELVFHAGVDVELDTDEWLDTRILFEPAFAQHLLNLTSLDIILSTTITRGEDGESPIFEVHTRCLGALDAISDNQKLLATTWVINNECPGLDSIHRSIILREVMTIKPKSGQFGGTDHLVAWTYSADDIESIMDCCQSKGGCLDYWDPSQWLWLDDDSSSL